MDILGLYVHVPFCTTKCGYCDFYSVPLRGRAVGQVVRAMIREAEIRALSVDIGPDTVMLGGGTPTVLPDSELQGLLTAIQRHFPTDCLREFTVEANPANLDASRARLLRELGADRVSIGAQSFQPRDLAVLERDHEPATIQKAVRAARGAGFRSLNLDLIFGIPGQTLAGWLDTLRRALDLGSDHLSCYGLTYEPGTSLTGRRDSGHVQPCDEQLEADMFCATIDALTAAGFEHYEISNYARPGQRCLHNLSYWHNRPYVGIGPSAASYLHGERTRNVPDVDRYVELIDHTGDATEEREQLDTLARAGETAMLGLRMTRGIDVVDFQRRTGFDPRVLFRTAIRHFQSLGLLECVVAAGNAGCPTEYVRLTREGLLKANTVMAQFVNPDPPPAGG
ncbi:MAG: radical SAM family heme chaperone HemW [Phycisphaerales bacterium]|nr:MAG: radical SAM family heme chaperone HemW [Phycisphaerales bacterium]